MSSALAHIGPADRPPAIPLNLVGDFGGAGMVLTVGILAALIERSRTGMGQVVDAAMTDSSALLMSSVYGQRAGGSWLDTRESNSVDGGAPFYNVYEAADGTYLSIGALVPEHYTRVLEVCGIDAAEWPSADDRDSWPRMRARLAAIFRTRTRAEWVGEFEGIEASFAPVLSMAEAHQHPYHRERRSFVEVDGVLQPAPAPRFGRTPSSAGSVARERFGASELMEQLGINASGGAGEAE
jgi:alpha-methylacyl-CoA racemase